MPIHLNNSKWRQYVEGMASVFDIFGLGHEAPKTSMPKAKSGFYQYNLSIGKYFEKVGGYMAQQMAIFEDEHRSS